MLKETILDELNDLAWPCIFWYIQNPKCFVNIWFFNYKTGVLARMVLYATYWRRLDVVNVGLLHLTSEKTKKQREVEIFFLENLKQTHKRQPWLKANVWLIKPYSSTGKVWIINKWNLAWMIRTLVSDPNNTFGLFQLFAMVVGI